MSKFLSALLLLATSGCLSVDVATAPVLGERSSGHVVMSNYGWTLFGCVPLICGNDNAESWCPVTFFKSEFRTEYLHAKLIALAEQRGCDVEDLQLSGDNDVFFDAWFAPIPWVLVYKESNLSANLVKRK